MQSRSSGNLVPDEAYKYVCKHETQKHSDLIYHNKDSHVHIHYFTSTFWHIGLGLMLPLAYVYFQPTDLKTTHHLSFSQQAMEMQMFVVINLSLCTLMLQTRIKLLTVCFRYLFLALQSILLLNNPHFIQKLCVSSVLKKKKERSLSRFRKDSCTIQWLYM